MLQLLGPAGTVEDENRNFHCKEYMPSTAWYRVQSFSVSFILSKSMVVGQIIINNAKTEVLHVPCKKKNNKQGKVEECMSTSS